MAPFRHLRSRLVPLLGSDIDTDQIIPAQYVNAVGTEALARALFRRSRDQNARFVLDRPGMAGRTVMLVGSNFGCGSSREAAAWALSAWGIRALIGRSFNVTFSANCLQNGLLPIAAPLDAHSALCDAIEAGADPEIAIDLERDRVEFAEMGIAFSVGLEPFARELLLRGMDELHYLLDRRAEIEAYETRGGALQ